MLERRENLKAFCRQWARIWLYAPLRTNLSPVKCLDDTVLHQNLALLLEEQFPISFDAIILEEPQPQLWSVWYDTLKGSDPFFFIASYAMLYLDEKQMSFVSKLVTESQWMIHNLWNSMIEWEFHEWTREEIEALALRF